MTPCPIPQSASPTYIQSMAVSQPLMMPVIRSAIRALELPAGSQGLDAGCGIGLQALLLAEAVGPSGHVTGLDLSPEFLRYAGELVREAGLSKRISFQAGDVSRLPFEAGAFDWAWSSCCVGYSPALEPISTVKELTRVVKPGGSVAILAWSSERLLPGYPLLEARLAATAPGIAPFVRGKRPELHFMRGLGWLRRAGLQNPTARTLAGEVQPPLDDDQLCALTALLAMRWPEAASELSPEDRTEYQRLCLPDSPEFILNQPDYYAFFTCTMFYGLV